MGCHTWFYRPLTEDEINKIKKEREYSYEIFGDDGYTDIDTPHDIFRIGGYPNDKLLSLEQTIQFIERNKNKIVFEYENWEEIIKDFWIKHPDGVIEFS